MHYFSSGNDSLFVTKNMRQLKSKARILRPHHFLIGDKINTQLWNGTREELPFARTINDDLIPT
ncbi:hypothetical protein HAD_02850 [Hyphomonas adhaerens MHS-3]|uniref:Uncharacterized protein n=1 Tax=Hyphomonas adhaerens MHS-3 TaxID=1280949 RepID=A0A069E3L9_9PROT|nr:hypothetical protein HAD_02850 [Hyphomonas adhaerens MHS-3]